MDQADRLEVKRWIRWHTCHPAKRHTCHPAKRRGALVLEILRGDTTPSESARKNGLTVAEIEDWRDRFLSGAEKYMPATVEP